jgi:predicted tellurium resistance membrane protein TerC
VRKVTPAAQAALLASALVRRAANPAATRLLAAWLTLVAFDLRIRALFLHSRGADIFRAFRFVSLFPSPVSSRTARAALRRRPALAALDRRDGDRPDRDLGRRRDPVVAAYFDDRLSLDLCRGGVVGLREATMAVEIAAQRGPQAVRGRPQPEQRQQGETGAGDGPAVRIDGKREPGKAADQDRGQRQPDGEARASGSAPDDRHPPASPFARWRPRPGSPYNRSDCPHSRGIPMFEWVTMPDVWVALATLIALEVVLGVDNIIFISILAGKLPEHQRAKARQLGIAVAAISRLGLLFAIAWIVSLTAPVFTLFSIEFSWRDLILIGGGLFLIYKSVNEMHGKLEGEQNAKGKMVQASFGAVILQIMILDMVFALDSIITAVGMVDHVSVMVVAILAATAVMVFLAKHIHEFVQRHPTVKLLALAFLILIGVVLIADGFGQPVPKGYIYFSMAFAVFVELLNIRFRKVSAPVQLHAEIAEDNGAPKA